jgi:hypothetical protein
MVTAEQIYETLLANGYSSVQAFGIMGNMMCESSLDPEEINPGGPQDGVGLDQWQTTDYPDAAGLVTGNPVQDMDNQIRFLTQHAVTAPDSAAASGSTGAEVAANWAVDFEKCEACSPTGSYGAPPSTPGGYDDRIAWAATIESWANSGNWPAAPLPSAAHPPAVAVSSDGAVNVFWRALGGFLWHGTGSGNGDLNGTRLGSGPMATGPAAGVDGQGHLYVYWQGTDGNLWEVTGDGSAWQAQANRGYGELGSAPAVAVSSDGAVNVFWRALGGFLWHGTGSGNGDLQGTRLGFGPMATAPAAGIDGQGHIHVYWVGTDGNLWEVIWDGSAWQGQFNRGYGKIG